MSMSSTKKASRKKASSSNFYDNNENNPYNHQYVDQYHQDYDMNYQDFDQKCKDITSSLNLPSYNHNGTETDSAIFDEITQKEEEVHSYEHKELAHQESFSQILEMECGEPMVTQHIRIDFAPVDKLDTNEFVVNKCTDFWKMIEANPEIQHLKVLPEKSVISADATGQTSETTVVPQPLDAIETIEDKEKIVNNVFVNKFKRFYCEDISGDYFCDLPQGSKTSTMTKWTTASKATRTPQEARDDAVKLCRELHEWDLKNPKSMEPPGHAPPLSYAMMQRNH